MKERKKDKKDKKPKKLEEELEQKKEELFRLKMDHSIKRLKDTSKVKKARKEVARIMTEINALKGKP